MLANPIVLISKFQRLGRQRRQLVVEAALALAFVSAALWVLPFNRAIRLGALPLGRKAMARFVAGDCAWAIETASRHLPWRTVCIQQGIAAQRMMRREGIDATLHYGIANDQSTGKIAAHVWASVDGRTVIGGEVLNFAPVATYP